MSINFNEFKILLVITAFVLFYFYNPNFGYKKNIYIKEVEKSIEKLNEKNIDAIYIDSIYRGNLTMGFPMKITNKDSISRIINYIKKGKDFKKIGHPEINSVYNILIKSKGSDLVLNVIGFNKNGTYIENVAFIEILTSDRKVIKTIRNDSLGIYLNSGKKY